MSVSSAARWTATQVGVSIQWAMARSVFRYGRWPFYVHSSLVSHRLGNTHHDEGELALQLFVPASVEAEGIAMEHVDISQRARVC